MKDPGEVLTALEDIIADLCEAAAKGAVVVEGRRDAEALAALHIEGNIEVLNRGTPLLALCDALASDHARITILTDWDAKGEELARQLEVGLGRASVQVDMALREALRRLTRGSIYSVEELPSFHRRVSGAAATKGQGVKVLSTDWKARKELTIARRTKRKQRGGPPGRSP